jgi:hypothetical protein
MRISSKLLGFFVSFIDLYVLWMTLSLAWCCLYPVGVEDNAIFCSFGTLPLVCIMLRLPKYSGSRREI